MREFFSSKKFKVILAVIALMFGMMLYSASGDGVANIPRNLLEMVTTPFQKAGAFLSNTIGGWFADLAAAGNNARENEELKQQIAELNQQMADYEKLKDENAQLKEIAGIKELYPDFEVMPAQVVSRDASDRASSFIIDRGSLHGIAVNDPVITANGLVGIVTQVGPISARVKTILSPEIDVSAIDIKTDQLGVVSGSYAYAESGKAKMGILSEETAIEEGNMIVTAGASGLYPKGIPIGTVTKVDTESTGITKYAEIEPFEDVSSVTTVQVVTSFLGQGSRLEDYLSDGSSAE